MAKTEKGHGNGVKVTGELPNFSHTIPYICSLIHMNYRYTQIGHTVLEMKLNQS